MPKFKNSIPFLILIISSINVLVFAGKAEDPFTPKAYVIRYWKKQISNDLPKPSFLIEKASPLTAVQSAAFSKLAANQHSLSTNLPSFCSAANLLCFPDVGPSLEKHSGDVNFKEYSEKNFTNYGSGRLGGFDSFKNYSNDGNSALDSFRRYSRDSVGHGDKFSTYARDTNVPDQSFNTYGTKATGGTGDFTSYAQDVNVPTMRFTSYSDDVNGRVQTFKSYSENANAGDQSFTSYGKKGNGAENEFKSYGNNSNVIGSSFSNYGENGNGANDSFTSYGENGNVPENNFKSYADSGNAAVDSFTSYRDQSNVGDDNFKSYAKSSNAADLKFSNYGNSFNEGTDTFSGYGGGTVTNQKFGFKGYGVNNTFKDYADKKRASFATYATKGSAARVGAMKTKSAASGKPVNKWIEPGKFFRESMLKSGTIMPMPDIRDKMPKRSFLPRVILSKLPFSSSKLGDLKKIFHAEDNSSMAGLISEGLSECERKPSQGESKRCVGSVEDMIDFATSVLGRDVVVRTTDNTNGSGKKVKIGSIKKINGGKITKSVSCHQSLFPYLLYYCHSVPKVRVYEADLLDPNSSSKINHGVLPLPFILHRRTSVPVPPINFSIVGKIFMLSVLMYLSQIFGYIGLKYSSPTLSSIMSNLSPAFTFILAFFFRMESIDFRSYTSQAKIIGTIVSISGAIIATVYSGPSVLSNPISINWIVGGILLASQYFLLAFALVAQAKIMKEYPVDVMVVFVFGISGLFVAGVAGLVMAQDLDAWKLQPNLLLVTILYMGFSSGFLNVVIQIWTLRLKGPVYVAMFKPLTIVIAIVMGVLFLGDLLHLGSVMGGIIITVGFYGVVWGKAKEESPSSIQITAPLLQPHHNLEQGPCIH